MYIDETGEKLLKSAFANIKLSTMYANLCEQAPNVHDLYAIVERNRARANEKSHENVTKFIHGLKERYFILNKEIDELNRENADIGREIKVLRFKAKEIRERAEFVKKQAENGYEKAVTYFKRQFNVTPDKAGVEVWRLENLAREKE